MRIGACYGTCSACMMSDVPFTEKHRCRWHGPDMQLIRNDCRCAVADRQGVFSPWPHALLHASVTAAAMNTQHHRSRRCFT